MVIDTPITPEIPEPEEEIDRSASSGAGGLDLASWATGFRKGTLCQTEIRSPCSRSCLTKEKSI
jgi:hypothetical protein